METHQRLSNILIPQLASTDAFFVTGIALCKQSRLYEALVAFQQSLVQVDRHLDPERNGGADVATREHWKKVAGNLHCWIGFVLINLGKHNDAVKHNTKAFELCSLAGDLFGQMRCYANAGACAQAAGGYDEAMWLYMRQLDLASLYNQMEHILTAANNICGVMLLTGKHHEALHLAWNTTNQAYQQVNSLDAIDIESKRLIGILFIKIAECYNRIMDELPMAAFDHNPGASDQIRKTCGESALLSLDVAMDIFRLTGHWKNEYGACERYVSLACSFIKPDNAMWHRVRETAQRGLLLVTQNIKPPTNSETDGLHIRSHASVGMVNFVQGDYTTALAAYKVQYKLACISSTTQAWERIGALYNVALTKQKLGHFEIAMSDYTLLKNLAKTHSAENGCAQFIPMAEQGINICSDKLNAPVNVGESGVAKQQTTRCGFNHDKQRSGFSQLDSSHNLLFNTTVY